MEHFNSNQQIDLEARNIHTHEVHDVSLSYTLEAASEDHHKAGDYSHSTHWKEPVFDSATVDGEPFHIKYLRYWFGQDFLDNARATILYELDEQEAAFQEDRLAARLDY